MIESESLRLSKIVGQILLAGQLDADAVELSISGVRSGRGRGGRDPDRPQVHLPDGILLGLSAEGPLDRLRDEAKLKQVLVNLVDNAIKYSPDGGRVTIRLDQNRNGCLIGSPTRAWASPAEEQDGSSSSTGSTRSRRRASAAAVWSLCICARLVERMDGQLSVESRPGVGSRFKLRFPPGAGIIDPEGVGQRAGNVTRTER